MTHDELQSLLTSLVHGDITPTDHARLQDELTSNAESRAVFRERMDFEAALRTWAVESPDTAGADDPAATEHATRAVARGETVRRGGPRALLVALAVTAAGLLLALAWFVPWRLPADGGDGGDNIAEAERPTAAPVFVGTLRARDDCTWDEPTGETAGRLSAGRYALRTGVAELRLDSGTNVVLEAPCEVVLDSSESARLVSGRVFVDVTELADGFTLDTPDARILDEGTQYAVALDREATEVHVYDGSVVWLPGEGGDPLDRGAGERIEAGEARRYDRTDPVRGRHVPFGKRQFVRRLEEDVRAAAGETLIAYDGFENVAGRLRLGRSGLGWDGGWQAGRRRGPLANVVDCLPGDVFGLDRAQRRQLLLDAGTAIRRPLDEPLPMSREADLYASILVERRPGDGERLFQLDLEPAAFHRGRRRPLVAFGVSSDGFPFVKCGGRVERTATRLEDGRVHLCVLKIAVGDDAVTPRLRVYEDGEQVDPHEPTVWTVTGPTADAVATIESVRLAVGPDAEWLLDEFRLGSTWKAVVEHR